MNGARRDTHKWEATLFECNANYDDIKGTCQHWECSVCGETFKGTHGDKPFSGKNCEDKRQLMEAVAEFKKKMPVNWGNGRKARGGRNVTRQ
jgi:hypothetical protein